MVDRRGFRNFAGNLPHFLGVSERTRMARLLHSEGALFEGHSNGDDFGVGCR